MEITAQLFRALANRSRIRILRLLTVVGERTVSQIEDATRLRQSTVSDHLRILAGAGLVWRRRSGRAVFYRLAEKPGNPVTRSALGLLRDVFGRVSSREPRDVVDSDQVQSSDSSDVVLFAYFTSFTHPRRLQIIRFLLSRGTGRVVDMTEELGMSTQACLRHLHKLSRRGLVRESRSERRRGWTLSTPDAPKFAALLAAVTEGLAGSEE